MPKRPVVVGARILYSCFLVLLGYAIGFSHGTWSTLHLIGTPNIKNNDNDYLVLLQRVQQPSTDGLSCSNHTALVARQKEDAPNDNATSQWEGQGPEQKQGTEDGWKSIHIFYGTRNHLVRHPAVAAVGAMNEERNTITLSNTTTESGGAAGPQSWIPNNTSRRTSTLLEGVGTANSSTTTSSTPKVLSRQHNHDWYSQARQDEIVVALLGGKRKGYFVDLAANDATHWSNTFALEQEYQWSGLCIEPNPMYWKNLSYRTCTVVGAIVGSPSDRNQEVFFRFNAGTHGGIADEGFDNNKRWQRHSQLDSTVPLSEIFSKAGVPRQIDYLSLDVEGAEGFVLTNFPLRQYRIQIITAERLKGTVRSYLKEHGYQFVQRITRWGESLWIHNESLPHLHLEALESFSFPVV
ncbi:hypothetical protein ACA910_016322 [Epithemia clementina (nom. ined.)]